MMLKMTAFWIVTCFKNAVKWNYLKSLLFYQVESSRFITYIMYSCNNVALILTFISTLCNKFLHWVLFTAAINVLYTIHVSSLFFTQSWRVRVKKKKTLIGFVMSLKFCNLQNIPGCIQTNTSTFTAMSSLILGDESRGGGVGWVILQKVFDWRPYVLFTIHLMLHIF